MILDLVIDREDHLHHECRQVVMQIWVVVPTFQVMLLLPIVCQVMHQLQMVVAIVLEQEVLQPIGEVLIVVEVLMTSYLQ